MQTASTLDAYYALQIAPVEIVFDSRDENNVPRTLISDKSNVVLARLREAARNGEQVRHLTAGGLQLTDDSRAALNCYLRTAPAMGRMNLPFDRIDFHGAHSETRYKWGAFVQHLGLKFQ